VVNALAIGAGLGTWLGRALLGAVIAMRGIELAVSARNARRLLARGAVEHGRGHYPAMVALHAGLLIACAVEPWLAPALRWPLAATLGAGAVVLSAQALRWWAIATLGERWSTRVLVLPGAAPVQRGPYRWLRHPNYLAVIAEVAALPLACGAWRTAIAATIANAVVLAVRIRVEERALGAGWREAFAGRPRLVPALEARGPGGSSGPAAGSFTERARR
jgi:methyltransferase